MSLRGPGRHTLMVQRFESFTGSMGQDEHRPIGEPVPSRGNLYPLTSDEREALGLTNQRTKLFHIHHGKWPGDQYAQATHGGDLWEQYGPVEDYEMGQNTQHQRVVLRWIGSAK